MYLKSYMSVTAFLDGGGSRFHNASKRKDSTAGARISHNAKFNFDTQPTEPVKKIFL